MNKTLKKSKSKSITSTETKLLAELDTLDKIYHTNIFNAEFVKSVEYTKLLQNIENTKMQLASLENAREMYPSIYNKHFSKLISSKKEFNIYKIPHKNPNQIYSLYENKDTDNDKDNSSSLKKSPTELNQSKIFLHKPIQKLLKNFMNYSTPYRGLLIIHGTGVGKTCTAITLAEQFKHIVQSNHKKIYIIRPDEFHRQIFEINKVKTGNAEKQCTGIEYLEKIMKTNPDLITHCEKKKECEPLEAKVSKIIDQYYEFNGVETWARSIGKLIYSKSKSGEEAHRYKLRHIRKLFNNTVLIIDEAHHLNDETDARTISKVLTDVLMYAEGLRLIMLTATPMFDKPENIITLINYLLINDKRPIIKDSIFDAFGKLTETGHTLIIEKTRGYVSYLRGNNPYEFAIRLSASDNLPSSDLVNLKTYPEPYSGFQNIDHKMKFLELVDCKMRTTQKDVYNYIISQKNKDDKTSTAWSEEAQASNFVYQSLEDAKDNIKNCYGDGGFKSIMKPRKTIKSAYQFNNPEYGRNFLLPMLYEYSSKIAKIIEIIKTASGPVFIYTGWIAGGLYPIIIALEMNGYRGHKGSTFLENPYKSVEWKGDYIVKSGSYDSPGLSKYLQKKDDMIKENVKVFLATSSASEGLSLFGYREVHILDPHFNLSRIEQAIGRTIRNESHYALPPQERNVSVYMYTATLAKVETVDLYKYRISELKAITTGSVEKILKENAIDCRLNQYGNIYDEKEYGKRITIITSQNKKVSVSLSDKPFSRVCNYMDKCELKCMGGNEIISSNEHKPSTLTLSHLQKDIEYLAKIIEGIVSQFKIISITDLKQIVSEIKEFEDEAIQIAISKIIDDKKKILDKDGNSGIIREYGSQREFLKFIPDYYKDENIEYQLQYIPLKDKVSNFDLRNYISKLKRYRDYLIENKKSNYETLIQDVEAAFNVLASQNPNSQDTQFSYEIKPMKQDLIDYVFQHYVYQSKLEIIITLFKHILGITVRSKLNDIEKYLIDYIKLNHIIYYDDFELQQHHQQHQQKPLKENKKQILERSVKTMYGFMIAKGMNLESYVIGYSDNGTIPKELTKEPNINRKYLENMRYILNAVKFNKVFGYLSSDSIDRPPIFKIIDTALETPSAAAIDKKNLPIFSRFTKGGKCIDKTKTEIINYISSIMKLKNIEKLSKITTCATLEILFRDLDRKSEGDRWILTYEEYIILSNKT
jgi:superfamily II DNA or RNA helicase